MVIYFRTKKLIKLCDPSDKLHRKEFDDKKSRRLQQRLMELRAADSLSHIPNTPPPRCRELRKNRKGTFSVDLFDQFRLLFIPANEPIPYKEDGGLDLNNITEIEIIEISDHYKD